MYLKDVVYVDLIQLPYDKDQRRGLTNTKIKIRVPRKMENFLSALQVGFRSIDLVITYRHRFDNESRSLPLG